MTITTAKSFFKKIQKLIEENGQDLEDLIGDRENYFEEKTEKWQESEKGEQYEFITEELQEIKDMLDDLDYKLDEFLNN